MAEVSPQQLMRNAAAAYLNLLASWQIDITPEVQSFVAQAVKQGLNSSAFLTEVRKTKFYAKRFPGIVKPGGTMRMTESQYISGYQQAKDYAASLGRNMSPGMYGMAIKNGNSPSEIREKLEAANKLKMYGPMFKQFSDYLQATGASKKPLTRKELMTFIMGAGPREWTDAYRTAYTAAQVENLGFDVGKPAQGGDIGYKGLNKIAKEIEVMGQSGDYTGLLASATRLLGQGDWKALGISNKDKVRLALGAPGVEKVAEKVTQAVNTHIAAFEDRANPQVLYRTGEAKANAPQTSE